MPITAYGVGPPLDSELRAEPPVIRGNGLDDHITAARQLPGIERCRLVHGDSATKAAGEETGRDVADLPVRPKVGWAEATRQQRPSM
jgi:hypothetical protein